MAQPEYTNPTTSNPLFGSIFTGGNSSTSSTPDLTVGRDVDPDKRRAIFKGAVVAGRTPALPTGIFPLTVTRENHSLCRGLIWDTLEDSLNRLWKYVVGPRVEPLAAAAGRGLSFTPRSITSTTRLMPLSLALTVSDNITITPSGTITFTPEQLYLLGEEGLSNEPSPIGASLTFLFSLIIPSAAYTSMPKFSYIIKPISLPFTGVTVSLSGAAPFPQGTYTVNLLGTTNA